MSLTLFQFPRGQTVPNYSPFCLKLETYLRLAKIPYESVSTVSFKKAPKKKLPFIQIDGEFMGDSTLIIQRLAKMKPEWDLDRHLTTEQRALTVAVQCLLEDSLVAATVHMRWADPSGWKEFGSVVFSGAPAVIRVVVGGMLHKKSIKRSWLHGIGRHKREEILEIADRDMQSVSALLGTKTYFFGDQPSSIDCVLYGVLAQFVEAQIPSDMSQQITKYPNLVAYVQRMSSEFQTSLLPASPLPQARVTVAVKELAPEF